jgi:hypothetical protein
MSESYLDGLLDELIRVEPKAAWDDVLHRARRARRRYTAVALTVAVLVLASCSWVAVKAFEGTPAPAPVRRTFEFPSRVAAGAAKQIRKTFPQADVSKAHGVLQVQTKDGPLDLWAAPATHGETCSDVGWEADMTAKQQIAASSECSPVDQPGPSIDPGTFEEFDHPYIVVTGVATGPVVTVKVTLSDGRSITLPVVEHFFLGALPRSSEIVTGTLAVSASGRDASGKVVASWKVS